MRSRTNENAEPLQPAGLPTWPLFEYRAEDRPRRTGARLNKMKVASCTRRGRWVFKLRRMPDLSSLFRVFDQSGFREKFSLDAATQAE
jgi:transposase InsO family protein